MMKFINRKTELDFLEEKYTSNEAQLIIIYGRRRIGKTETILQFAKDKKHIYFLGRLESREDTLRRINASIGSAFGDTNLLSSPLRNWDEILEYLGKKSKEERFIFIMDEYPFMVEKFLELTSVMQDRWDSELIKSKIMMVLSGSSIGMMEKYAMDYKSPLYGRRTGQWKLEKIGAKYLKKFYPHYAAEDLFLAFSCIDTIPGYLVKFSPEVGIWDNIEKKILSKGEFLYEEVEVLLREEFRDPSNYMSILSAIASGATKLSDIYSATKLDKSLLSKYLYILEKTGIVYRERVITESQKGVLKGKRTLYFLKDNFFDFWLRFVHLNKSELEMGRTREVLGKVKDDRAWFGRKFERFAAELLPEIFPEHPRIGKWWHKEKEIDIVALNETEKRILFCECKWQDRVNAKKVLNELREKSKFVDWNSKEREEHYAIFAKSFKEKIKEEGVSLFDLKDLDKVLK